jgi:hypothetical protein
MNNKTNNNPYGHLLDKYLDPEHLDWETKQQRKEEAKGRYGHLLDYAKPDTSILEHMARLEDERIERRKQEEEERKLAALRRQEQIAVVKRREENHNAEVRNFAESIIENREARRKKLKRLHRKRGKLRKENSISMITLVVLSESILNLQKHMCIF